MLQIQIWLCLNQQNDFTDTKRPKNLNKQHLLIWQYSNLLTLAHLTTPPPPSIHTWIYMRKHFNYALINITYANCSLCTVKQFMFQKFQISSISCTHVSTGPLWSQSIFLTEAVARTRSDRYLQTAALLSHLVLCILLRTLYFKESHFEHPLYQVNTVHSTTIHFLN